MSETIRSLFSSAGRSGRKRYWAIVGSLFAVGFLIGLIRGIAGDNMGLVLATLPIALIAALIAINNYIKRLHDLGMTGWWVLLPPAGCIVGGILTAVVERSSEAAAFGVVAVVYLGLFACIIWLGSVRGQPDANRFGPPPNSPEPVPAAA